MKGLPGFGDREVLSMLSKDRPRHTCHVSISLCTSDILLVSLAHLLGTESQQGLQIAVTEVHVVAWLLEFLQLPQKPAFQQAQHLPHAQHARHASAPAGCRSVLGKVTFSVQLSSGFDWERPQVSHDFGLLLSPEEVKHSLTFES